MNQYPTPIDPDAVGRQYGALPVAVQEPGGVMSSRLLPYAQLANGNGPTIAIVASGSHNAIDAALVVSGLMRDLAPSTIRGRIRLVCALDAAQDSNGIEAQHKAIVNQVLPGADLVIELTSEHKIWSWHSMAITRLSQGSHSGTPLSEVARVAFGAPFSTTMASVPVTRLQPDICLSNDNPQHTPERVYLGQASLEDACQQREIDHMQVMVGSSPVEHSQRDMLNTGCRNALVALNVLDAPFQLRASRAFRCAPDKDSTRATMAGALHLLARPGQQVYRGDVLAHIVDPAEPWRKPAEVSVGKDAVVVATRRSGLVKPGDAIALFADEIQG